MTGVGASSGAKAMSISSKITNETSSKNNNFSQPIRRNVDAINKKIKRGFGEQRSSFLGFNSQQNNQRPRSILDVGRK